ncbi:unnamed protein product [Victoria cruziana]
MFVPLRDFASMNEADRSLVESTSVFVAVLCVCIVVGHLIHGNRWVKDSFAALLIGCVTGLIILLWSKGASSHILRFDEELFFICLLPPIIFNAGFQVKKKQFFHNFLTIILFGVVGVFISSAIIAAGCWWLFPKVGFIGLKLQDYLALGAIFSATDTVCTLQVLHQDETPLLYSLVFGEGVVNDATSIVLFRAVQKFYVSRVNGSIAALIFGDFFYLFSTSTALGILTGLMTSYVTKTLYFGRHSTDREISLLALMAYLSYMVAELLHLSGILTVFFCGIVMSHYAWHNTAENSRIATRHTFAAMSFIAETFIFLYVGMDALDIEKWKMTKSSLRVIFGICSATLLLVLLGRAAFVFPLSALSNYMSAKEENSSITLRHQVIIWWAGLMRGAVSIALAFNQFTFSGITWNPVHATIITTTIIIVLFSTMVFGLLTKPLIDVLLPHHRGRQATRAESLSPKEGDLHIPFFSLEESAANNRQRAMSSLTMLLETPVRTIHCLWRRFDDTYMRPVFGGPS